MKTLTSTLAVLALSVAFATAADAEKKKGNPEQAFKKIDANSDNSVTLEEFKNSPRGKKDAAKAEEFFKKKDKDNDGKLSLEEFTPKEKKKDK